MTLSNRLQHFRREHDDILRFLREFEAALALAAGGIPSHCSKGLAVLRKMEAKLVSIGEHCRCEENCPDSPFRLHLDLHAQASLSNEHEQLALLTTSFVSELLLSNAPRGAELLRRGREVLALARHHIAYEEGLLKEIEDAQETRTPDVLREAKGSD